MNIEKIKQTPPPGVMGSLRVGFDIVSSHIWLILPPILFDLFLWLGTRLSAGKLYAATVAEMIAFLKSRPVPVDQIQILLDSINSFNRFNWLSALRTFPIGIPSLEAFALPATGSPALTPFGLRNAIEIESSLGLLGWTTLLVFIGWVGGGVYFRWVSMTVLGESNANITFARAVFQSVVLSLLWAFCLIVILTPTVILVGLVSYISAALANGLLFFIAILAYWLIVPFFFMPHGIFAQRQNALYSLYSSLRLTRFTLPSSGLFVFTSILLSKGLSLLWSVPESDSWMRLVGISGHAFISATILAASFVYYRDMNAWLQNFLDQLRPQPSAPIN